MAVASSDLDTGAVNDKIVRTESGAYIVSGGAAPAILPTTDRAWNLPIGSRIRVTSTSPTQYFQADIRTPNSADPLDSRKWTTVTTLALTTPMSTILAGLDTWADLVLGAPTS